MPMTQPITTQAKQLGYQATYTSRGVRLYKRGGRHVLFRDDVAVRAYLNAVEKAQEKQKQ